MSGEGGSMDKPADRRTFTEESSAYLEMNEVYFLFRNLMKGLITHQPDDPYRFMIDQLKRPPPLVLCMLSAPGLNRRKHALEIAGHFGLTHIDVGGLLKKTYPNLVDKGQFAPDTEVIELVSAAIQELNNESGYILDGFPRTRGQARALQRMRIVPEKVIILNGDSEAIKTRLAEQVEGTNTDFEQRADLVKARLQQHLRHIHTTAEIFKNSAIEVNAHEEDTMLTDIESVLHRASGDPRGPLRVCVVGPLGSGRTTQSRFLASDFGVVHVDVNAMVAEYDRENPKSAESFSDEQLCELVGKRLRQVDCLRKGWVLDGFPNNVSQAQFLKKAHLWPTRVIHLSVPESVCLQRLSIRKVDPITGAHYYGNPPQLSIRQRLVQLASDSAEAVSARYHQFYQKHTEVLNQFPQINATMRSNQDPVVLQFAIQDFIKLKKSAK